MEERRQRMQEMDAQWARFRERVRAIGDEERHGEAPDRPVTLAQVVAHVAASDGREVERLEADARGEALEEIHESLLNARWLVDDTYVELDEAEARADAAHERRRTVLESLDDAGWERIGRSSVSGGTAHYRSHADDPFDFPISREECLRLLDEARTGMRARLGRLVAGTEQPPAGSEVSLGVGIAHVARWDRSAAQVLAARQRDPDAEDPYANRDREWNARWRAQDEGTRPEDALAELDAAADALRQALGSLDDSGWQRSGIPYTLGTTTHYRSHTEWPLSFPLPERGDASG